VPPLFSCVGDRLSLIVKAVLRWAKEKSLGAFFVQCSTGIVKTW